jgi:hypothetical protein
VELPGRLAILPFRNKVLLPGAIVRIRCTNPSRSVRVPAGAGDSTSHRLAGRLESSCNFICRRRVRPRGLAAVRFSRPERSVVWLVASDFLVASAS